VTQPFPTVWWQDEEESEREPIQINHFVSAIVVNHNGSRWLNETLGGLNQQTRAPETIAVVDVASDDDSRMMLDFYEPSILIDVDGSYSYSQAIDAVVEHLEPAVDRVEWLWLLHDDSAPDSTALEELLAVANKFPHAAVIGCKVVDWAKPDHVLEVGSSLTAIGTRYTGLEHGERDQGQHDESGVVHAVSNAGMLVRKDVWQSLGGLSDQLAHFRTELDFCWRVWSFGHEVCIAPRARIRHAAATVRRLRPTPVNKRSPHYIDRRAGALIVLSQTPARFFIFRWLLLALAGIVRGLGYLVVQDVVSARDEWRATVSALTRRSAVKSIGAHYGTSSLPTGVRPTLAQQLTHAATEVVSGIQEAYERVLEILFPHRADVSEVGYGRAFLKAAARPGSILAVVTILVGLIAHRSLFSSGALATPTQGFVPTSGDVLWQRFLESWHTVGLGSAEPSHPITALGAILSFLTGGNPAALVAVISVMGLWFTALSMHLALRAVLPHSATRVWLAALYGLSPVVVSASVSGDWLTVIVAMVIPPTAVALKRAVNSWRAAAGAALGIAVIAVAWPAVWIVGLLALLIRFRAVLSNRVVGFRYVMVWLWSVLLWLPWSLDVLLQPMRWFDEPGVSSSSSVSAWRALFGGGSDLSYTAWWWSLGLVLTSAVALGDSRNNRLAKFSWNSITLVMLVAVTSQILVNQLGNSFGFSVNALSVFILAALLLSLASTSSTVRVRLSRTAFGWRQISTALAIFSITALPLAGLWNNVFQRPAETKIARVTPVNAQMLRGYTEDLSLRTLLLTSDASGQVTADILDERPLSLGDREVVSDIAMTDIAELITEWFTSNDADAASPLIPLGIGYIATPAGDAISSRVSSLANITKLITARDDRLLNIWRVNDVESIAAFANAEGEFLASVELDQRTAETVQLTVEKAKQDRILQVALRRDGGWSANINGTTLNPTESSIFTEWVIPSGLAGEVRIERQDVIRDSWLITAGIALFTIVVVLAPRRRNSYTEEWLEES